MDAIRLSDVSVAYDGRPAVDQVSLAVPSGTWTGLIGPNGAGKTTLLRAIAGLVSFAGDIDVAGARIGAARRRELSRRVAFLPQRPVLPASMTVTDYVLLGRTPHIAYLGTETPADLRVVREVLDRLDLSPLAGRPLGELSGGESQRAVLARALAQRAPVLLLDEPTAALDVGHQQHVLELIDELRIEQGLTVLAAMHDLTLAAQFAGSLVLLDNGRVALAGRASEVLTEESIRKHYGASIRIVVDAGGGLAIVPARTSTTRDLEPREVLT